jgi:hypothetical protein
MAQTIHFQLKIQLRLSVAQRALRLQLLELDVSAARTSGFSTTTTQEHPTTATLAVDENQQDKNKHSG